MGKLKENIEIVNLLIEMEKTGKQIKNDEIGSIIAPTNGLMLDFNLSDNLYAKVNISKPKFVFIWMGANIMLDFNLKDAKSLLEQNLITAETNLETFAKHFDFIEDQVTITEVSIARLQNYNVEIKSNASL